MILSKYNYQNQSYKSGFIFDFWACSSAEKQENGDKFAGAYPAGFWKRFTSSFANYLPKNQRSKSGGILHVCAGRMPKNRGWLLDNNKDLNPDYYLNAETFAINLLTIYNRKSLFDWTIADPPYNVEASIKYFGVPLLDKSAMLKQMAIATKLGGFVGLLDQVSPAAPRALKRVALICITSIPNQDARLFTVWQKIKAVDT